MLMEAHDAKESHVEKGDLPKGDLPFQPEILSHHVNFPIISDSAPLMPNLFLLNKACLFVVFLKAQK